MLKSTYGDGDAFQYGQAGVRKDLGPRVVEADFPNMAGNCILDCIHGVLYGVDCADNK